MSEDTRLPIARMPLVYTLPAARDVVVHRDVVYGHNGEPLTMDVYYPPKWSKGDASLPAVIMPAGYPDPGIRKALGCWFKDMEWSKSWASLGAASGFVVIVASNREPAADATTLLRSVRENAPALGVDARRIGLWACSGHGPLALWLAMEAKEPLACVALSYPYTFDTDAATGVADMSARFGFVTPASGKSGRNWPRETPIFLARAGKDEMPSLNDALDRFVRDALLENVPMTLVNHHSGPHAYDLSDDSQLSHGVIRAILAFTAFHLSR